MSEFVTGRALRTPQHTYAVSTPKRAGWRPAAESDSFVEYILYDLFADPFQHTNLAGRTGSRGVEERLRGELLKRIGEAGGQHPAIERLLVSPILNSQARCQPCIHSFLMTTPNPGAWGSGM